MKVRLSHTAMDDLRSIARWIARDRPNAAKRIAHNLRAACAALGDNPRAYEAIDGGQYPEVRRRPLGRHLIFYRIEIDQVVVIRILDGAQDIDRLF